MHFCRLYGSASSSQTTKKANRKAKACKKQRDCTALESEGFHPTCKTDDRRIHRRMCSPEELQPSLSTAICAGENLLQLYGWRHWQQDSQDIHCLLYKHLKRVGDSDGIRSCPCHFAFHRLSGSG